MRYEVLHSYDPHSLAQKVNDAANLYGGKPHGFLVVTAVPSTGGWTQIHYAQAVVYGT